MNEFLERLKVRLDDGDVTLVVGTSAGEVLTFSRRGVADLLELVEVRRDVLRGASVADKVIGKAAAALMIAGGVSDVYTRVISVDAKALFEDAGVPYIYDEEVEMISNRDKTGRCPIDTRCAPIAPKVANIPAVISQIKDFLYPNLP